MNTKVENFAFGTAIFFMFFLPIFWIVVMTFTAMGGVSQQQARPFMQIMFLGSGIFFPLLCVACSIWIESAHFKSLTAAEQELSDMTVSNLKTLPPNWKPNGAIFVCENVVVANDYFKSFLWGFRKIVGGRSRSFERLIERGRREVTVRLLRKAKECGTNVVWNIRYETSIVQMGGGDGARSIAGVEMMAYGTAFQIESGLIANH